MTNLTALVLVVLVGLSLDRTHLTTHTKARRYDSRDYIINGVRAPKLASFDLGIEKHLMNILDFCRHFPLSEHGRKALYYCSSLFFLVS